VLTRRDILSGSSAAVIAGAAPRSAWGRNEADVVIIGAGLAGLYAAHRLEGAGLKAIIVEGELRVGGRLHTLDDLPGKPDAGGIQVGSGYKLFRAIADDLKVALIEGAGGGAGAAGSRSALLRINGMTVTPTEWQSSTANRLPENERSILPQGLGLKYDAGLPRLAASPEWMDADPALDISYRAALVAQGASPEALRLIEANFNGNTLSGMSQLQIMRSAAIFRAGGGPASTIAGGSQRFPEAMARNIKTPIRLGHIVTAITEDADGVAIFTSRGAIHARHAICTIPFAALRQMSLKAPIPPAMAKVIKALPYTRASFAFVSAASPFWREDGLPETLWTDDPLLGRVFVLGDSPPMLKTWTTGTGADLLDRMAPAAAASEIIARLEAARPSAKGKLKVERLFSWQKSPMARGIYHHIGTGQAALLAAAVRAENRRLHFAGEHLAEASSGMEAALESGNRVARMIVARS
jgi:monoamine oxidase